MVCQTESSLAAPPLPRAHDGMERNPTPAEVFLDPAWAYETSPGFYDEVLDENKRLRPHWNALE